MVKRMRTIHGAVLFGLLLLLLPRCGRTVSADTCFGYPRCGGCSTCIMNVREFGHYQTVWRRWPGDPRPAEVFPRSINAEVLPTPEPRKQQPLPRTRLHGPAEEAFDAGLPGTLLDLPGIFPSEGGILPSEPGFDFTPGIPETPAEPGGGSLFDTPPSVPGMPFDSDVPTPFESPLEQPFSTMPDAGAALPKPTPLSVTTTETPLEQPLPAIASQAIASQAIASQAIASQAIAIPEDAIPEGAVPEGAVPDEAVADEAVAQQAPQTDVPLPDFAAPDQPAAEASDVAADGLSEPGVFEAVDTESSSRPELAPPEAKTLQANWMAALHPGFRGETDRIASSYPSIGPVVAVEPDEVPAKGVAFEQEANTSSDHERPAGDEQNVGEEAAALPVALGGYCPVELLVNERWAESDPRWTATHEGRRYLFAGETQRQRFLDDPDHFVPVHSGNDPVLVVDDRRRVPGRMDYCVTYEGRLYMFSMADTLARFQEKPERYAAKDD